MAVDGLIEAVDDGLDVSASSKNTPRGSVENRHNEA